MVPGSARRDLEVHASRARARHSVFPLFGDVSDDRLGRQRFAFHVFRDDRQRLLLDILSCLSELGVNVVFPSRTVYYRDADPDGGTTGSGLPGEFARPVASGRPLALKRGKAGPGHGSSDRDAVTQRGELDDESASRDTAPSRLDETISRRGETEDSE